MIQIPTCASETSQRSGLLDLPDALLELVLEAIPLSDLAACCCSSKSLQQYAQEALHTRRSFCSTEDYQLVKRLQASRAAAPAQVLAGLGDAISYAGVKCPSLQHFRLNLPHELLPIGRAPQVSQATPRQAQQLPLQPPEQPSHWAATQQEQQEHLQQQQEQERREAKAWPVVHALDSLYQSLPQWTCLRSLTLINIPTRLFSMDVFTSVQPCWPLPHLTHFCIGRVGGIESVYNHSDGYFCDSLSDMSLRHVARGNPSLRSLELHRCGSVTDDGLMQVAKHCRQLRSLALHTCPEISELGLIQIAERCTLLERLSVDVARCKAVGDLLLWDQGAASGRQLGFGALFAVAANCPHLQELYISEEQLEVGVIDDMCVFPVLAGCHHLKRLALVHVEVTDALLIVIAARCPQLEGLELSHTCASDQGIAAVTKGCQLLRTLRLAGHAAPHSMHPPQGAVAGTISDRSLKAIATNCTNLQELALSGLRRKVTSAGLKLLAAAPSHVLQKLQVLVFDDMGPCTQGLCLLLGRCLNLRQVSVKGMRDGTDEVAQCLAHHCRYLTSVDFSHSSLSEAGLQHLGSLRYLNSVQAASCLLTVGCQVNKLRFDNQATLQ